jgi:hypothetical protein
MEDMHDQGCLVVRTMNLILLEHGRNEEVGRVVHGLVLVEERKVE